MKDQNDRKQDTDIIINEYTMFIQLIDHICNNELTSSNDNLEDTLFMKCIKQFIDLINDCVNHLIFDNTLKSVEFYNKNLFETLNAVLNQSLIRFKFNQDGINAYNEKAKPLNKLSSFYAIPLIADFDTKKNNMDAYAIKLKDSISNDKQITGLCSEIKKIIDHHKKINQNGSISKTIYDYIIMNEKRSLSYNFYIFFRFCCIDDDDCSLSVSEDSGFYF
jgi:hypothetical protein